MPASVEHLGGRSFDHPQRVDISFSASRPKSTPGCDQLGWSENHINYHVGRASEDCLDVVAHMGDDSHACKWVYAILTAVTGAIIVATGDFPRIGSVSIAYWPH